MKKVFVAGSTGFIGQNFVKEALKKGFKVTTLTPDLKTTKLEKHQNLDIIEGTVLDKDLLNKTVKGNDYMLSTIGDFDEHDPDSEKPNFRVKGTKYLINAAKENNIQKMIVLLGASLLKLKDGTRIFDTPDPLSYIEDLGSDFEQTRKMWETWNLLKESNINWTAFCPGIVTPGEKTNEYKIEIDHICEEIATEKVVIGDLVDALIKEFECGEHKHQLLGMKTKSIEKTFHLAQ